MAHNICWPCAFAVVALVNGAGALGAMAAPPHPRHVQHVEHALHAQHATDHANSCGEFMYWHDSKCVDARAKPGKAWMAIVF